jgi:hypothetical protein
MFDRVGMFGGPPSSLKKMLFFARFAKSENRFPDMARIRRATKKQFPEVGESQRPIISRDE